MRAPGRGGHTAVVAPRCTEHETSPRGTGHRRCPTVGPNAATRNGRTHCGRRALVPRARGFSARDRTPSVSDRRAERRRPSGRTLPGRTRRGRGVGGGGTPVPRAGAVPRTGRGGAAEAVTPGHGIGERRRRHRAVMAAAPRAGGLTSRQGRSRCCPRGGRRPRRSARLVSRAASGLGAEVRSGPPQSAAGEWTSHVPSSANSAPVWARSVQVFGKVSVQVTGRSRHMPSAWAVTGA